MRSTRDATPLVALHPSAHRPAHRSVGRVIRGLLGWPIAVIAAIVLLVATTSVGLAG